MKVGFIGLTENIVYVRTVEVGINGRFEQLASTVGGKNKSNGAFE